MRRIRRNVTPAMICLAGCGLLVLTQRALPDWIGGILCSLIFLGTILAAGIFGGWKSGIAATALGIFTATVLFSPPYFIRAATKPVEFLRLLSFAFIGVTLSAICEALQRAWKRIEDRQRRLEEEVSERRRSQVAEQVRADEFMTTLASIGDGVIRTDSEGRVTFMNQVAEELIGWTTAQAAGRMLSEVFHIVNEQTRVPVANPVIRALTEGINVGLANHTILIAKCGRERPIDDSAAPIRTKDGKVIGSVLVFRDITERKLAEQKIQEARSRLESTLVAAEIGTWEFDIVNNQIRPDPNLAHMLGMTLDQVPAGPLETFTKSIHRDDQERVVQSIQRAVESGSSFESEYRIIGADQAVRWVIARGRVEKNAQGTAVRLPGVVVDITQQKRAEDQLRASEERRRQALDSAELGAWHLDPVTNSLTTDERFRSIFGVKDDQLDYEQAFALIHPEDRVRVKAALEAATRPVDPVPYAVDYRVNLPDGSCRWVFAKGRANYEKNGPTQRLASFDGTVADITERKRLENDLRQLASDLSAADHRKDEFLATLAHELRNPLAPIRCGLELVRLAGGDGETIEHARKMMERQLAQLVRLVDDLMDVSRISQGKLELRTERVNLTSVIHSAVETSRTLIEEMGHELTVSLPTPTIFVNGDFVRLSQIFMNLLNNSAKYSEPGSHIWVNAQRHHQEVLISVKDDGIGIAPDQLPLIFDLFSQIDHSIGKSQGGLGIGLSLVKRLVEMHGGSIKAQSEGTGKGAEFVVRLPMIREATNVPPATGDEMVPLKSSLRVLIVDDNRDGADSLSMMLRAMGTHTRTAYDGAEALVATQEFQPHVILLDIGLPKINGYEVCRRIREQPDGANFVIVAQTGWGAKEDRERTREAGFDHHLVKPVDPKVLMKLLTDLATPVAAENDRSTLPR